MLVFSLFIKWSVFSLGPPNKSMSLQVQSNPPLLMKFISISFHFAFIDAWSKVNQIFERITGMCLMPFRTTSVVIILMVFGRFILCILLNFLFLPQYCSISGGVMRLFFFSGSLRNYYHEHHGIHNSFHNHNHVLVLIYIHEFGMILHSL